MYQYVDILLQATGICKIYYFFFKSFLVLKGFHLVLYFCRFSVFQMELWMKYKFGSEMFFKTFAPIDLKMFVC